MSYPTRRKRRNYRTQNLMQLIGVLAAVLIVVVIIAIAASSGNKGGDATQTDPSLPPETTQLTMSTPTETEFVTTEQNLLLQGMSDPRQVVTVSGAVIAQNTDGTFSHTVQLQPGVNEITVSHKDKSITYTVEYRYAVQTYSPADRTEYNSGATISLVLVVRQGSTFTVSLGDQMIEMKETEAADLAEGFTRYTGTYELPSDNTQDLNLGKITYTVTCNGLTETYTSTDVICKKMAQIQQSNPSATPDYGPYIDVGSGYIVEIVNSTAETFDGATMDDYSDPRNNYLPQGTVDYCRKDAVSNSSSSYMLMRCGRRVYIKKPNYPPPGQKADVVNCYRGTLPDHNEIGFASLEVSGNRTVLTFDSMWKAPFYFHFGPQTYIDSSHRDFRVTDVTSEYVEITFCYATVFEGTVTIPESNPLFSSAEFTQNESDCTLRLNLKKTGGFYGWDAYYNDNDQLCFSFLNPAKATKADNAYGADLTGVEIMLDVGHGGWDGGSEAEKPDGTKVDEAELNLNLANALKSELESMGATVVLNRSDDASISVDERIVSLKKAAPDLCVAIHQNSISGHPDHSGCQVLYFTPFSQPAAQRIYEQINGSGVYKKTSIDWHLYYVARQATCPVVLTENGFMTNAGDLANMLDATALKQKAQSIAQGVANYFLDIQ